MAGSYNMPEDDRLDQIIKDLKERVAELEKLTRTNRAAIDSGALLVKNGTQLLAAFGDLAEAGYPNIKRPDGTPQMGAILRSDDGKLYFAIWDDSPLAAPGYQQYWAWFDRASKIIFSSDADAGWGLARPWLHPGQWVNTDQQHWPATQSATFVSSWDNFYQVQNPKLYINFMVYADAATSGEARLMIDGVQYGPTVTASNANYTFYDQTLILPQSMEHQTKQITIEYRRTAGAGNVRTHPRISIGRQT